MLFLNCLNEFFKEEKLCDDNKYFNEKINKKVDATKICYNKLS